MAAFVQHIDEITLQTKGEIEIHDLTPRLAAITRASKVRRGQLLAFTASSTSAITTLEHEPGLLKDLPAALERLFPRSIDYGHQETWQDGNGHSHVRASFLKPDLVVPVRDAAPQLGQWQQVVFVELDNKPRKRTITVHVWGTD